MLLAIVKQVAHAAVVCEGRRRLKHQTPINAFLLTKAGGETQAATQPRMEVVGLAKAGADNPDQSPSLRAVQMNEGLACCFWRRKGRRPNPALQPTPLCGEQDHSDFEG